MIVQSHARVITLHPGDVALGVRGDRLRTLLGSCVAIVLTDPKRTVGVMCHIVHATPSTDPENTSCAYADAALQRMVRLLQSRGIIASMCDAYVLGGGNMFPRLVTGRSVGDRNVEFVLDALALLKARVLFVDVGGAMYRQLDWLVGPDAPQAVAVPL